MGEGLGGPSGNLLSSLRDGAACRVSTLTGFDQAQGSGR